MLSAGDGRSSMPDEDKPLGQLFAHVYLERGKPTEDSPTMRRRLAANIEDSKVEYTLAPVITRELGVDVKNWRHFFANQDIIVVLNAITVAYKHLVRESQGSRFSADAFVQMVRRIFAEENVSYQIDDRCGVHPLVDAEFDANRHATVSALAGPRYDNARDCLEKAHSAFSELPADGKGAIRNTFSAAECLFKLMLPKKIKLDAASVQSLQPVVQRAYAGDRNALTTGSKMLSCLADWVDGNHPYRHEPGHEEIAQPPLELAVNLVSLGHSFIRWLAELDQAEREE
jgi:hypothetical protein